MHLKEINLKGFKSFPDRTRLTFSPGVSVIVGPNGCGKSNITDAVLWALGEQSPTAVRGRSMQDVIFAGGAKGQSRRRFAEVEVVIDNAEGRANTEFAEISILRRIERNGEGEYRLNGARCRLADVVDALADTNLGREMHSVISQGRVEAIVNSKPRDRRLLIEEAAGLGKHRKRRHRAQLKLERTADNLDRALDVEREARSRLRPLKAQAEAAERQAKLALQEDELRSRLVASELREREDLLSAATATLDQARSRREGVEARLEQVRGRRTAIEERIAEGERGRRLRSERLAEASAAVERVGARAEAVSHAERELRSALQERQLRLDDLGGELEIAGDTAARIVELEAELAKLGGGTGAGGADQPGSAAAEAEGRRAEAEAAIPSLEGAAEEAGAAHARALAARDQARAEAGKATARRSALAGELAAVEARLARAALEQGEEVLAGMVEAASGLERAVSAALGERLRASVVGSIDEGVERLGRAEGAARALVATAGEREAGPAPLEGARRLLDLIEVAEGARPIVEWLLADAWLVDELTALPEGFAGIAVTVDGDLYDGSARELRRIPREGTDPALLARSEREELAGRLAERERTEQRSANELKGAEDGLDASAGERDRAEAALRAARRRLDETAEEARRAQWLAEKRATGQDAEGPMALRRAEIEAELGAERRHAEAAARARDARDRDRERLARRIELERGALPALARLREALEGVAAGLQRRVDAFAEPAEEGGEEVAAELRECSRQEAGIQLEMREASEAATAAEVEAAQLRNRRDESAGELGRLAESLEQELEPAAKALSEDERGEVEADLERLSRRREQIGPVNPLAEREYAEEREHVRGIAEQRQDLEKALAELRSLIRRTDREIATSFEETFEATAENFEQMVAELFPGGRGRLRRVELNTGEADGASPDPSADDAQAADGEEEGAPGAPDERGVEIEVTPAGKSMRRLSLLSGGEKSLVALAFVFAVLLARPCPFYILDEVEAALDDINLDRFLRLVRRFAERSQFVVVTHQKRTMDAADVLYGVSMGDDGITKVVSRKLPRGEEEAPEEHDAAVAAADAWSAPPEPEDVEAA
jgi:chromosome segregation protein